MAATPRGDGFRVTLVAPGTVYRSADSRLVATSSSSLMSPSVRASRWPRRRAFARSRRIPSCELEINGGSVMLADAFPEFGHTRMPLPGELATASVSLEYAEAKTVDEIFAKATGLGAKVETSPTNSFWGTRVATFRDPFGHRWILNAPLA